MKNNEKFLLDLENIPDRFLDEVNNTDGNASVVSKVRKEKIQWMTPVSVAALVAAVIAVPVFIYNLKLSSLSFFLSLLFADNIQIQNIAINAPYPKKGTINHESLFSDF